MGLIIVSNVGNTVREPSELVTIMRAIKKPNSESMLNFEKVRTAKPKPTEVALKSIAFPEPRNVA